MMARSGFGASKMGMLLACVAAVVLLSAGGGEAVCRPGPVYFDSSGSKLKVDYKFNQTSWTSTFRYWLYSTVDTYSFGVLVRCSAAAEYLMYQTYRICFG
jgi:hypothetical protein